MPCRQASQRSYLTKQEQQPLNVHDISLRCLVLETCRATLCAAACRGTAAEAAAAVSAAAAVLLDSNKSCQSQLVPCSQQQALGHRGRRPGQSQNNSSSGGGVNSLQATGLCSTIVMVTGTRKMLAAVSQEATGIRGASETGKKGGGMGGTAGMTGMTRRGGDDSRGL